MHNKLVILKRKQRRAYIYYINRWLMRAVDVCIKLLIRPNEPTIRQRETLYSA